MAPFVSPSRICHSLCKVVTAVTLQHNRMKRHVYGEINRTTEQSTSKKEETHDRWSMVVKDSTMGREPLRSTP